MVSSQEPSQRTGPLGDVKPPAKQEAAKPEEKWLPCNTPGYVKNSITGAVKRKED